MSECSAASCGEPAIGVVVSAYDDDDPPMRTPLCKQHLDNFVAVLSDVRRPAGWLLLGIEPLSTGSVDSSAT